MYEYGHWHGVYWHTSMFFNIILLLLIVFGVVYLIQCSSNNQISREGPKKLDSAMDTLKKRYASGEINAEEFAQKKRDLES
jgi:putative membrane protein